MPYKSSIYAWEVQNEPIWNLLPGLPISVTGRCRIGYRTMRSFLRAALALIESEPFRFPSTVGHRFARDLALLPTGTLRQFHFYPVRRLGRYWLDRTLPDHASTRAFLGEIGSLGRTPAGRYPHGDPWRELAGRDAHEARERVLARLELARSKGYPLALLWPDRMDEPVRATDPLKLTPEALRGVQDFLRRSPATRWSNS
jgi:hypothetical protein